MNTENVASTNHQVKPRTLEEYRGWITIKRCLCAWCDAPLRRELSHCDHDGGLPVIGFAQHQWLYIVCVRGHEWALWKLLDRQEAERLRRERLEIDAYLTWLEDGAG